MKKFLFLLSMATMLFTSCEGPAGRDGFDGRDGLNGKDGQGIYWFVDDYTINANQWELVNGKDQLNSFYRAEIKISQLTRDIYEDGNVFCYMYQKVNGKEVQTLLPYTIPIGEKNPNGSDALWTETYAYDFMPGSIMVYVNYSDFYTSNRPPTTSFRVVLNY